ncbi:MAG: hypothetical protein WAY02_12395, partial [Burkholderiaceae bacterium]
MPSRTAATVAGSPAMNSASTGVVSAGGLPDGMDRPACFRTRFTVRALMPTALATCSEVMPCCMSGTTAATVRCAWLADLRPVALRFTGAGLGSTLRTTASAARISCSGKPHTHTSSLKAHGVGLVELKRVVLLKLQVHAHHVEASTVVAHRRTAGATKE